MSNGNGTPIFEDYTDPSTALPPQAAPAPPVPDAPSTTGLDLRTGLPQSIVGYPRKHGLLTQSAEAAPAAPGVSVSPYGPGYVPQDGTTPNWAQSAAGVAAGTPGSAGPMTKLGKLLYILRGVGTGAIVGSTQPTFGTGFEAAQAQNQQAQQFANQQEQARIGVEQARQNLQYLPFMRQLAAAKTQADIDAKNATAAKSRAQATRYANLPLGKPTQVGDRMLVYNPDDENADEHGFVDIGAGKPVSQSTQKTMLDYYMRPTSQGGEGLSQDEAYKRLKGDPYGKIAPEIYGQIGGMPTTSVYKGQDYGTPEAARTKWGQDYQQLKMQESVAPAEARGKALGYYKPFSALDADGNVRMMWTGDAVAQGLAPAELGSKIMGKEAQFQDIKFASDRLRTALNKLDSPLSATQIAELTAAMSHSDPTIRNNLIAGLVTQHLTDPQREFITWVNQLNERAMSLRNLAGMGQGSQDLRAAVMNTLPGVRSGDRAMALKQLDAFDNLTDNLYKGVPKIKGGQRAATPASPAAATPTATPTPTPAKPTLPKGLHPA